MPTYKQNEQTHLPAKVITPKQKPLTRIPLFGPMELGIVLDASYSMAGLKNAVITGFNSLVREQKPSARFNLNLFASRVRFLHRNEPIKNLIPLTGQNYRLDGSTALLDGIGLMIGEIGNRFDQVVLKPRVLVAILTDGMENASQEFVLSQVADLIKRRRTMNRWEFLFLTQGDAGFDYAIRGLGIPRSHIVQFDGDPADIKLLLNRLSKAVNAYQLGDSNFARLLLEDKK